jgi:hypothetical protein
MGVVKRRGIRADLDMGGGGGAALCRMEKRDEGGAPSVRRKQAVK